MKTHLPGVVVLHLPAPGQLQLFVGEHVEEGDQVTIVLVALEVVGVSTHLADHVLQAGVARKHSVGTLDREGQRFRNSDSLRYSNRSLDQCGSGFTDGV